MQPPIISYQTKRIDGLQEAYQPTIMLLQAAKNQQPTEDAPAKVDGQGTSDHFQAVFRTNAAAAQAIDFGFLVLDLSLIVIKKNKSPNGKPLLVSANEVSGTTTIFEIQNN